MSKKIKFPRFNVIVAAASGLFGEPEGDPPTNPPPANPPAPTNPPPPPAPIPGLPVGVRTNADGTVTLNQEQLNSYMATNRRQLQDRNRELAEQLKTANDSGQLTAEQIRANEARIEQLENETRTKEELHQGEVKKLQTKYDSDTTKLKQVATDWENRYGDLLITNDLMTAAVTHKAYNPSQVVALLKPSTRKQEGTTEGKPNGIFSPRTKFTYVKDGKETTLDVSPVEAVKLMTELPEYANLFISAATPGLGGGTNNGGSKGNVKFDPNMSMADYKANRTQFLKEATEGTQ